MVHKLEQPGVPVSTCTCSLHAIGCHPCRHIIAVAAYIKEKINSSFLNDRFEKDKVPFTKGKAASVNYSVDTSVIAPGRTMSVVIKTVMMMKKRGGS